MAGGAELKLKKMLSQEIYSISLQLCYLYLKLKGARIKHTRLGFQYCLE